MEGYLQKAKLDISNHKESPLICRVFKTAGLKISKTKGISYSRIRETFYSYISEITTIPKNFGLHSLRSGGASAAVNNGLSGRRISKPDRSSADQTRGGYIKDSVDRNILGM